MSLTIWKYALEVTDEQRVILPLGSMALHVGVQGGDLCIWVLVDPKAETVQQMIRVYGTGNPLDGELPQIHVGSVQMGPFVWHVFWEVGE